MKEIAPRAKCIKVPTTRPDELTEWEMVFEADPVRVPTDRMKGTEPKYRRHAKYGCRLVRTRRIPPTDALKVLNVIPSFLWIRESSLERDHSSVVGLFIPCTTYAVW